MLESVSLVHLIYHSEMLFIIQGWNNFFYRCESVVSSNRPKFQNHDQFGFATLLLINNTKTSYDSILMYRVTTESKGIYHHAHHRGGSLSSQTSASPSFLLSSQYTSPFSVLLLNNFTLFPAIRTLSGVPSSSLRE
jgi:hypothetical protein